MTNKISQSEFPPFSLDSSNLCKLNVLYTKIVKNFTKNEILKALCSGFLKNKEYLSGFAIKKIKIILENSNQEYCKSLVFLSNIAVNKEKLLWICENTLEFFDLVHLNVKQFLEFYFSKINVLKVHRSFGL